MSAGLTFESVDRLAPDPHEWPRHNPFVLTVYPTRAGRIGVSYHSHKETCGGGGYAPSLDALKTEWALSDAQIGAVVQHFADAGITL